MDEKPKVRMLDAFPAEIEGRKTICLRDPERLTESTLFMTDLGFYFVQMMDGSNTIEDIQADYTRRFGETVPGEQVINLMKQLDDCYFLDNGRYREKQGSIRDEYEKCSTRPCSHAGLSYPLDPGELNEMLDGFYETAKNDTEVKKVNIEKVCGIMAPHIDVRHGGPCFAAAYDYLRGRNPDVFVVFGVGHNASQNEFTVVPRDYETPLGVAPVDRAALDIMKSRLGDKIIEEDFIHRSEHSIEFQVVFLQHLWAGGEPVPILPILCTSFHDMVFTGQDPGESEAVKEFLASLEEAVGGRDACYIAGVDLAHVGMKFGDLAAPGEVQREHIRREDTGMLNDVENADAAGFFKSIAKDHDARRICGFPAMYMFLKASGAETGHLLKYEQLFDDQTGSLVSYAGLVFEK